MVILWAPLKCFISDKHELFGLLSCLQNASILISYQIFKYKHDISVKTNCIIFSQYILITIMPSNYISMAQYKRDIILLLTQWDYVSFALSNNLYWISCKRLNTKRDNSTANAGYICFALNHWCYGDGKLRCLLVMITTAKHHQRSGSMSYHMECPWSDSVRENIAWCFFLSILSQAVSTMKK